MRAIRTNLLVEISCAPAERRVAEEDAQFVSRCNSLPRAKLRLTGGSYERTSPHKSGLFSGHPVYSTKYCTYVGYTCSDYVRGYTKGDSKSERPVVAVVPTNLVSILLVT